MNVNFNSLPLVFALFFIVLLATRLWMFFAKTQSTQRQEERLRALEQKVELISQHIQLGNKPANANMMSSGALNSNSNAFDNGYDAVGADIARNASVAQNNISAHINTVNLRSGEAWSATLSPGEMNEISRLLRSNRKLEAIKLFRERSGADLKASKDAVEAIERSGL